MKYFRNILYSESVSDAHHSYKKSIQCCEFPQWTKYVDNYWSYKEKWYLCFRGSFSRGHVTNNYCEVAVRLHKDHTLG